MPHTLLPRYPGAGSRYDEMLDPNGQVRAHWLPLLRQLAQEAQDAPQTMAQRLQTVQRQVRENGVTYNVYADPRGSQRPWNLDVLPLILPDDEWQHIERAVIQRANLLNRILLDTYSGQQMMSEGYLPAGLVYGNGGFLRPCHAIVPPGDVALHTYAADLVRDRDGVWRVVNDRTQSPSGAAYALENRQIILRAFPELFRELKIADLDGFFATLRDSLDYWGRAATALSQSEQPLMVLLTPGPYNETYYEQSYLARFLGFPLVEGSDLTVRNGKVWMKTLSGLQRVHVILRRLDDDYCDPLELRADSSIGVVGLTEAARRGNVLIANSLGTNVLESGALFEFLPQLCQRLLGQDLLMPSVESLWCGRPEALEQAIGRIEQMVIKPSYPQLRVAPVFGSDLNPDQRAALIAKMRERPQNHVAQAVLHLSHTPTWQAGHGLSAAGVGLRVFACATPNGYQVMPGGLARIASAQDTRVINMQHGGASKDVWVATRGKSVPRHLLHHATTSAELSRGDTHLSSRVVDNFFWFGRYAERCENIVRLTRTALEMRLHANADQRGPEWACVMDLCQSYNLLGSRMADGQPSPAASLSDEHIEHALIQSVIKPNVPGLASYLQDLFAVAFHLRERLSLDNWRKLNQMMQQIESAVQKPLLADALILLDDATTSLMTITGFALDGMTRDLGWRFLSIGRWIERMQFLCRNLQSALTMPPDSQLEWLLELADSIVTYRSRYMAKPEWLPVLDLLLLDETNPRSIIFQLKGLKKYLNHLPDSKVQTLLGPTLKALRALQPQTDLQRDSRPLQALLDQTRQASYAISERIEIRFFSNTDQLLQNEAPPAEYGEVNYGAGTP
jgi:uncharacterized circularly permuted ATP-grasp superfamily protein/uncharacterized alpha-E superfamily protein